MSFFVHVAEDGYSLTAAGYGVCILLLAGALLFASFLAGKGKTRRMGTKQLVFCAAAVALAMVTSMVKIYSFPFGGSVTLCSMLFICLIGYLYGPATGLLTGAAYGILQFIVEPVMYFPLQVIVDYVLGFGALGLSGLFCHAKHGLLKGYLVGILGRYVFVVLSGWLFFGEYAWEGWNALPYSLVYNGCYVFGEAVLTVVILCIPAVRKAFVHIKELAVH